jgi:hypothetical protein
MRKASIARALRLSIQLKKEKGCQVSQGNPLLY